MPKATYFVNEQNSWSECLFLLLVYARKAGNPYLLKIWKDRVVFCLVRSLILCYLFVIFFVFFLLSFLLSFSFSLFTVFRFFKIEILPDTNLKEKWKGDHWFIDHFQSLIYWRKILLRTFFAFEKLSTYLENFVTWIH